MKKTKLPLTAVLLLGSLLSYGLVSHFLFCRVIVAGNSMTPTLKNTDVYLLKKWAYLFNPPSTGDIVVLADPIDGVVSYAVKRVVATPHQTIVFSNGFVYVDNKKLVESYLPPDVYTYPSDTVRYYCAKDEYFVLGDNRNNSADGRVYGPVNVKGIIGKLNK